MNLDKSLAIGVDIEEIERFKGYNLESNNNFLRKIFTPKELTYCFSKKNSAQHLAARFAGKEAVIKAMSSVGESIPFHNKIEITNNEKGVPKVGIDGEKFKFSKILISLSHCQDKAIAFCWFYGE